MRFPEALLDQLRRAVPLPSLVGRAVPLKRAGTHWSGLCPFHDERSPSFAVYDANFHCFGCGAHGDAFSWMMRREGASFAGAVAALAAEAGLTLPGRAGSPAPAPMPRPPAPLRARPDAVAAKARMVEAARRMWVEAAPIGDIVTAYLDRRGLLPLPDDAHAVLRQSRLRHPETGDAAHPVMLARIDGEGGAPIGVHRTYLTAEGRKLDGVDAKLSLGGVAGGAVRLAPIAPRLGYAEGIETALAVWHLTGIGAWACISAGVMTQQVPPEGVSHAVIFADRDPPKRGPEGTGLTAARALHARLRLRGVIPEIRLPHAPWGDYADIVAPHAVAKAS
jgi:hypothetical protein